MRHQDKPGATRNRPIFAVKTPRDDQLLARTLADAFQDDPALCWILPDADERQRRLPKLFTLMIKGDRAVGMVLASPGAEVVTLWRAPGQTQTGMLQLLRAAVPLLNIFGTAIPRALAVSSAITVHHPQRDDFWYLQYAGVAPRSQGSGWGGVAIREGLTRASAEGRPTLLETAKHANVALYQSLGFAIVAEWNVPNGGPRFWTMMRD